MGFLISNQNQLFLSSASHITGGGGGVAPGPVTNLNVDGSSSESSTDLLWTNPAPEGDSVEIWKSTDGVIFALFDTTAGFNSGYSDTTGMSDGDIWYYKVRATNAFGNGPFSNIVSVSFNLTLTDAGVIAFPTLIRSFGFINIIGSTATQFNTPLLKSISGDFLAQFVASLASVDFSSLAIAIGNLNIRDSGLTSLSLPNLINIGGDLSIQNCASITTLSAPSLTTVGSTINTSNDTLLLSADFSSLVSVTSDTNFSGIGAAALSFPALQTVGNDFNVSSSAITSLSIPTLTSIGTSFFLNSCPALITLSGPSLTTITASLGFASCTSLISVSFPALTLVDAIFGNGCTALTSFSMPAGVALGTDFVMSGCTVLATVNIAGMTMIDGGFSVDFTNCAITVGASASGTGINGILRRCTDSALTQATISLQGGTNATPGASGLVDKAQLISAGNLVNTN